MKECKIVKSILAGRVASFPGLKTRASTSQSACAGRVVRIPGAFWSRQRQARQGCSPTDLPVTQVLWPPISNPLAPQRQRQERPPPLSRTMRARQADLPDLAESVKGRQSTFLTPQAHLIPSNRQNKITTHILNPLHATKIATTPETPDMTQNACASSSQPVRRFMPKRPAMRVPMPMPRVAMETLRSSVNNAFRFESRMSSTISCVD